MFTVSRGLARFIRLNLVINSLERGKKTVPKVFCDLVKKHPDKTAFYFEDQQWTFQQVRCSVNFLRKYFTKYRFFKVDDYSNKIANFFKEEGFQRGDTIALLLESRPEYVCMWLGLSKIGVITALINTNLTKDPLKHSIEIANSKALIYGTENKTGKKLLNLHIYEDLIKIFICWHTCVIF